MIEYNIIGNFNYKRKEYQLLIDNNKKYFFLGINNDNSERYIDISEYIALINEFKNKKDALLVTKDNKPKKKKLIPKIFIGGILITITASFINIMSSYNSIINFHKDTSYINTASYVEQVDESEYDKAQQALDELYKEIEKETENFKIDERQDGLSTIRIFNSEELDDVFENKKEDITYDDIINDINNNPNISDKYKQIYLELINNYKEKYPTIDLRILHHNLQTLAIAELDERDMKIKARSIDACAVYRVDENTIYVAKGCQFEKGTWDYQVITHEMGHTFRELKTTIGDKKVRCQFESISGHGTIVGEAMNSLMTLRSYDTEEKDIAYQLQSNMNELMVESMDNYFYDDYINHNLTYYENQLNEYNEDDQAVRMIGLMELQYDDYHNNSIIIDESEFHDLYDYIARMYYKNNLNPNMTREEAEKVRDEFIYRITYDVPEEYNINTEHMKDFFQEYCVEIGLKSNEYSR